MASSATKKLSRLGEWLRSNEPPLIDLSYMTVAERAEFDKRWGL